MPDHGQQLGVDINQLYRTAHYLHRIADDFGQAAKLVTSCQSPGASGPWTTMVAEWGLLQFEVGDVLSDTSRNHGDTATVLGHTADNYAATDQTAAATFRSLQADDQNEQGW